MKNKRSILIGFPLFLLCMIVIACPFVITTAGRYSVIPVVTPTPSPTPTPTAAPSPTAVPTSAPTPEITPVPTSTAQTSDKAVVVTPIPTPSPTPTPRALPMDTFDIGSTPIKENFTEDGYEDETISVKIGNERIDGSLYSYAYVKIAHPSQFRTALGGTATVSRHATMYQMSKRSNAVVAINGDHYAHRKGNYIVRQSTVLNDGTDDDLDMLFVDFNGDFHIYHNTDVKRGFDEMKGNIYHCFAFGPALVIDGELCTDLNEDYSFKATTRHPRSAIGQLGPNEYLLVVVDGRSDKSRGIDVATIGQYMYDHGCVQAFNLDGGMSSHMYFEDRIYNLTTGSVRGLYDMIYFASAAEEE